MLCSHRVRLFICLQGRHRQGSVTFAQLGTVWGKERIPVPLPTGSPHRISKAPIFVRGAVCATSYFGEVLWHQEIRLSPLKEWENPTESAAWRSEGPGDPPFKSFSYMLQIPGSHAPKYITLDYLHIYHLGYGMDASASSIVLLCKLGHFGAARALDDKLEVAYNRFDGWCKANKRTTSIDSFSQQSFGMTKPLVGAKYICLLFKPCQSPKDHWAVWWQ